MTENGYIWVVSSTVQGPIQGYRDRRDANEFAAQMKAMGVPVVVNSLPLVEKREDD